MSGRLIGLFLLLCFGFRFLIEFFKEEQSLLIFGSSLFTMGQWLSIPFIALGAFFIFFSLKENHSILTNKGERV
jgi:prolipoprotein diacylglyceryltransferase